jgi:hypothetical protein
MKEKRTKQMVSSEICQTFQHHYDRFPFGSTQFKSKWDIWIQKRAEMIKELETQA